MKQKILVLISVLLTTQLTIAQNEIINPDNIVEAGKIKWSNTNDTILNVCYDTKLDSNIFIENEELPKSNQLKELLERQYNYYSDNIMYLDFDNAIQQWTIYTETKEKIEILKVTGIKLNEEFNKKYTQNKGHLPTIALNLLIKYYLKPGIYKIERDIYLGMINDTTFKVYTSNQLTLIINDNKHTKPIKLLKNEPIKSGDNIYLGFQKETTDSLYTFNWLINEKKDSTLTYKNLYQINKDYTGKLNIKLQTTTNLSGCTAYDSVELNITPRKIDTTYITKTDTIYITKTDTIYITKTDTIYITKTDTIYIDKTSEKTAINTKQVNLNVWPNPTTTFVNAEAEEPFSYTLLNNVGEILKKEEGNLSYTIDMSEYSDGIYFIKTSDGVIRKIVKE